MTLRLRPLVHRPIAGAQRRQTGRPFTAAGCEDGPCLVDAYGVKDQVEASLPLRAMTRNALDRSPIVQDHVIRATLARKVLVPAAAHADNERGAHPALCDLNCKTASDTAMNIRVDFGMSALGLLFLDSGGIADIPDRALRADFVAKVVLHR
jgi:hypothetical protein